MVLSWTGWLSASRGFGGNSVLAWLMRLWVTCFLSQFAPQFMASLAEGFPALPLFLYIVACSEPIVSATLACKAWQLGRSTGKSIRTLLIFSQMIWILCEISITMASTQDWYMLNGPHQSSVGTLSPGHLEEDFASILEVNWEKNQGWRYHTEVEVVFFVTLNRVKIGSTSLRSDRTHYLQMVARETRATYPCPAGLDAETARLEDRGDGSLIICGSERF